MKFNGQTIVMGGLEPAQVVRPVVGTRRARVAYPLQVLPTIRGAYGRAWLCDLDAARRLQLTRAPDATVAHWIVEAPWSHEVVHSYSLVLVHLRFDEGFAPVVRHLAGATHEFALYAINPMAPRAEMLAAPINPTMWIPPIVFAAQGVALTDEAAGARVRRAAELVCEGRLSPHPDHVRSWAELFGDNMLRVAHAPEPEKEESGISN